MLAVDYRGYPLTIGAVGQAVILLLQQGEGLDVQMPDLGFTGLKNMSIAA